MYVESEPLSECAKVLLTTAGDWYLRRPTNSPLLGRFCHSHSRILHPSAIRKRAK
jgi:hypothetical protein